MFHHIREWLIGPPLPTQRLGESRIDNVRALAALSPDALASVAYANQEIYLGLVVAGAAGLTYSLPIALAIVGLLAILTLSYNQTIAAYPGGGGSYTVARENLGQNFGLVAAAALVIDYILNAAVSVTAGVAAISSAFPMLWPYRVPLSLCLLLVITVANLRGIQEAGTAMVIPVYLFIGTYIVMIVAGVIVLLRDGPAQAVIISEQAAYPVTVLLVLHTFAAGCTALTGVEAISNAVPVFREPASRNARRTMIVMALLMGVLFAGTIALTQYLGISVAGESETILSGLARRIFGTTIPYFVTQASTLLVLIVAANTSFMGFPRVAALLARDGFLPRQLTLLGDRLVFENGIVVLAGSAALLVIVFNGDTHALIPLFAIGAFLAFTLSQGGMVSYWLKHKGPHWQAKFLANGLGFVVTLVAVMIIAASKFQGGAWIVLLLIPGLVFGFMSIKNHYTSVASQLTLKGLPPTLKELPEPRIVIPVASLHRGVIVALRYARSITHRVIAVHVEIDPGSGERLKKTWDEWGFDEDIPLRIVPCPYRSLVASFLETLDQIDAEYNDGTYSTVLLPEFIAARFWQMPLHNQTADIIRLALLYRRRKYQRDRVIIEVPMHLRD